jgi:hypothetical protein
MEKTTITRQEIYDLVCKESLTSISKRLNIPYTHLQKVCRQLSIPVPSTGYWMRKMHGKSDDQIPLPQDYSGVEEIKLYPVINYWGSPKELTFHSRFPVPVDNTDDSFPYIVSKRLTDPDPIVLAAQKQLEHKYSDSYHHSDRVVSVGVITIRVNQKNVGRALRFMDAVIKMIRSRGHKIDTSWSHHLEIDGESYEFKLIEIAEKGNPDRLGFPTFNSTGILSFSIDGINTNTWKDGRVPIEDRLPDILAKLEAKINYCTDYRAKQAEERRQREEQERIIREQQQRIEKERSDFKDFYQQAKRLQRARFMREYLIAYEQNAVEKGVLTDEAQNWIRWAREKADWYDPLVNKADDLLNQMNINKLLDL